MDGTPRSVRSNRHQSDPFRPSRQVYPERVGQRHLLSAWPSREGMDAADRPKRETLQMVSASGRSSSMFVRPLRGRRVRINLNRTRSKILARPISHLAFLEISSVAVSTSRSPSMPSSSTSLIQREITGSSAA